MTPGGNGGAGAIATLAVTGSTNTDMLARARAGAPEGAWLRADRQTDGRGRQGRGWSSASGGNLHASTLVWLRSADPPAPTLALVAGVALEEVASAYAGEGRLRLKWPNDLLAGPAKVAGILLEREGDAVVMGIGVNLASHPHLPDRPTTDLATLRGSGPDPAGFCLDLAEAVARWLARWRGEGLEPVRRRWLERGHPVGAAIALAGADGRMEGVFDGLAPDGSLRLRTATGVTIVSAGDVHLL